MKEDELLVFCERELKRWQGVMEKMKALTSKIQEINGSTKQELYDRKMCWWFEDEKDLKDDLEWQEKKSELNENGSDWQDSIFQIILLLCFLLGNK